MYNCHHDDEFETLSTPEGLRAFLDSLAESGPQGWSEHSAAVALLRYVQIRLKPLASSWNRPIEDVSYATFVALQSPGIRSADDPWGALTRAVERALKAEAFAERHLLSTEKARRQEFHPQAIPVRTGSYEHFLHDVLADHSEAAADEDQNLVLLTATLLTIAGWNHEDALPLCEYLVSRAADMRSHASAIDSLRKDDAVRCRLGIGVQAWSALLSLLIGVKPRVRDGKTHVSSKPGIFVRVLLGEDLPTLLSDHQLIAKLQATAPVVGPFHV